MISGNRDPGNSSDKVKPGFGTKVLKKSHDGSTYLPWLNALKKSLAFHIAASVQEYGSSVILDQTEWKVRHAKDYDQDDDTMKRELIKERSTRRSAATIVYNLIMALLDEEVRQLVEADKDFRVLNESDDRSPFELLKIVKKIVTTGITTDVVYQCMVNLRNLNDIRQKPSESVRLYVDRIKAAIDAFDSVTPYGKIFVETDMLHTRKLARTEPGMAQLGAGLTDRTLLKTTRIKKENLECVVSVFSDFLLVANLGGLSPGDCVRLFASAKSRRLELFD